MKKAILQTTFEKHYLQLKNKVKLNNKIVDIVKLTTTIAIFLLTVIIYGYFVNISSTKGYFLRQELKSLEDAKFASSVTKLAIMKQEKQLWDTIKLSQNYNQKKVVISPKVVYIPVQKPQLAKR